MTGVIITIKNGKVDPDGEGFKTPIARPNDIKPNNRAYYVISEILWDIAVRARPLRDNPFFSSSTQEQLNLSAEKMNKWRQNDLCPIFDGSIQSPHSLSSIRWSICNARNR